MAWQIASLEKMVAEAEENRSRLMERVKQKIAEVEELVNETKSKVEARRENSQS
jgi:hypothetical protein